MNSSQTNRADEADTAPRAIEHPPIVPSERDAWIGLAATLVLCLAAASVYFWLSGAHGK